MEPAAERRSPKYPYTRDLLRIALAEGMTQEEIARLCRTTQSVVSAWVNGKSKAKKDVLAPLLKRFGHRVNRVTARVYLVQEAPPVPWAETERGRLLTRIRTDAKGFAEERMTGEERRAFVVSHIPFSERRLRPEVKAAQEAARAKGGRLPSRSAGLDEVLGLMDEDAHHDGSGRYAPPTDDELAKAERRAPWSEAAPVRAELDAIAIGVGLTSGWGHGAEELATVDAEDWQHRHTRVVRVEGPVVWRHTLGVARMVLRKVGRHGEEPCYELDPVGRWVVHHAGDGLFRLVVQRVRDLVGADRVLWERVRPRGSKSPEAPGRVLTDDDSARWLSTIHGPFDVAALIAHIESLLPGAGPHDRAVVPFTLARALVEHGHDVPDVVHLSST